MSMLLGAAAAVAQQQRQQQLRYRRGIAVLSSRVFTTENAKKTSLFAESVAAASARTKMTTTTAMRSSNSAIIRRTMSSSSRSNFHATGALQKSSLVPLLQQHQQNNLFRAASIMTSFPFFSFSSSSASSLSRNNDYNYHHPHQQPLPQLVSLRRHFGSTAGSSVANDNKEELPNKSKVSKPKTKTPSSAATAALSERELNWRILKTMSQHVWPSNPHNDPALTLRKRRVVASLGLMLAGKAVTIQVPYLFKYLVDSLPHYAANSAAAAAASTASATTTTNEVLASSALGIVPPEWIPISLLLGYGVSRASAAGFQEWRNAVFAHVAQDAIRHVGRSVFDHVHALDLQFHLSRNTGQISRVLDRGQRSISFVLNAMVFHIGPTVLEVSLVTGLMAYQFGSAHAMTVVATVVSYVAFTIGITQWRTKFRREMNRLENQASSRVVDSLLNYETVQYFNNAAHESARYEETLKGYQKAALEAQSSLSLLNFGQTAIFSAGLTAVMWLTTQQVLTGASVGVTTGDLVLVNGLLFQLSVPLFFIGSVYREVKQSLIDMENMIQLKDTKPVVTDPPHAMAYDPARMGTSIEFCNVQFAYPTAANPRPILQGTSLYIPQGKTVAIVGSSGCGKSTILRLLYRFYNPTAGNILVGGKDIVQELSKESLQRSIAVVPQDTVLFHETIAYNLQYGNLNATWDQVVEAAKKAQIHDTILSFADGYDTIVGERGLKLSGGEKQRVAIARAMLKNAPILLCDEPTSSLDSETETDIMNHLKDLGKERTTIIIAHRLSTIQDCDEIIVMHHGQVVERGTHEELVQVGGRYTELLHMQQQHEETVVTVGEDKFPSIKE